MTILWLLAEPVACHLPIAYPVDPSLRFGIFRRKPTQKKAKA
jgi:hypothetical protein